MKTPIPIALFAYRRPDLLARTLESLRANDVKLIHAYSDGPRTPDDAPLVEEVRTVLKAVDWADVHLVARDTNAGLGPSIVAGLTEMLTRYDAVIMTEDDLLIAPGAIAWISAALEHYKDDDRVMSVSGWTHPSVTPPDATTKPHFSLRFSGLVWGTWPRGWRGMDRGTAADRLARFSAAGGDPSEYGVDIPLQASVEVARNLWAVRYVAEHLEKRKLSLCPPWSMVEHIGYDPRASNAAHDPTWHLTLDRPAPPIPDAWPEPVVHPDSARIWRKAIRAEQAAHRPPSLLRRAARKLKRLLFG